MRKLSLLIGALGGAMAGYLLSDEKLRKELVNAKNPEKAAKALGKHLQRDGMLVVKDVQAFVTSEDVQQNLQKAKKFARAKFREAKEGVESLVKESSKRAGTFVKSTVSGTKGGGKKGAKNFRETNV
ncbi:hypothetical protein HY285_00005 [Candidatus Peregrinibacteria bacterium]|nr:hypothetical protein [Candidatus Peregrinibacteria bacterium]MBI3815917.1 hypothetical protein [Candidatus Peregrinibacteria bacterium]